jgi:hypothetical protein
MTTLTLQAFEPKPMPPAPLEPVEVETDPVLPCGGERLSQSSRADALASVAWLRARSEDCRRKADRIEAFVNARIEEERRLCVTTEAAKPKPPKPPKVSRLKFDKRGKRILHPRRTANGEQAGAR